MGKNQFKKNSKKLTNPNPIKYFLVLFFKEFKPSIKKKTKLWLILNSSLKNFAYNKSIKKKNNLKKK